MAEHAAAVAHRRLRRHRAVGDDLRHAITPVLARDVVDDFVAAIHAEVDVEVGHRHAFGVEESLEQQVVRQGVEIGDAERPRDQRARTGTAARTDRNALLLTPVDEVRDDQEVTGEPHLDDDVELGFQARRVVLFRAAVRRRHFVEPLRQSFARTVTQPGFDRVVARHRECGQRVLAELHLDVAAQRQRERVVDRVRHVGEDVDHFLAGAQELLRAVFARTLGVVEHAAGRDADARFVRFVAGLVDEANIVRTDHRNVAQRRRMQRECVERFLALAAGAGQLEMQALAEHVLPVDQPGFGEVMATAAGKLRGEAVASGECEQAAVVLTQPVRAHRHAVVAMAFHPHAAEQARQREIALSIAAEQRHAGGRFVAVSQRHVGAEDGLDARRFGRLVELHGGEEVVDVGQRDCRLAEVRAPLDQLADTDRRVGERILGMQVQMDEAGRHAVGRAGRGYRRPCRLAGAPVPTQA
ncbi:hypothetical protein ACVWZN_001192 [Lysobacter sp. HA35]